MSSPKIRAALRHHMRCEQVARIRGRDAAADHHRRIADDLRDDLRAESFELAVAWAVGVGLFVYAAWAMTQAV